VALEGQDPVALGSVMGGLIAGANSSRAYSRRSRRRIHRCIWTSTAPRPFADRKQAADSAQALIRRTFDAGSQIRQANVLPFNLPPIIGLSTSGGFEYQLEASLIPFQNSLFFKIFSLIICVGNWSKSGCSAAVSWY
jgi:hypothetical protein